MDFTERGFELMIESMSDLADAAKLQFGLSTGAVVLFVHVISGFHHMPVRTGILTLATLFFGFSAINCIKALIHLTKMKTGIGDTMWRSVENRGNLFLERSKDDIVGSQIRFGKMERYFYAGVTWSVIFMIAQFVASFRS